MSPVGIGATIMVAHDMHGFFRRRRCIMAAEWYYKSATSKEVGPFTPADLKRLASEGRISPNTLVRKGTEGRWVSASKIKGLVNAEAARPTAIPPTPVDLSTPSVPVSREPEEEPEISSAPVPRLPTRITDDEDSEFSDDLPKKRVSPGILIGAGIGSLIVVGLIVLIVSRTGKLGGPSQNQSFKLYS